MLAVFVISSTTPYSIYSLLRCRCRTSISFTKKIPVWGIRLLVVFGIR